MVGGGVSEDGSHDDASGGSGSASTVISPDIRVSAEKEKKSEVALFRWTRDY